MKKQRNQKSENNRKHSLAIGSPLGWLASLIAVGVWAMGVAESVAQGHYYQLKEFVVAPGPSDDGLTSIARGTFTTSGGSYSGTLLNSNSDAVAMTWNWVFDTPLDIIYPGGTVGATLTTTKNDTGVSMRLYVTGGDGILFYGGDQAQDPLTDFNYDQGATSGWLRNILFSADTGEGITESLFNDNSFNVHLSPNATSQYITIHVQVTAVGVEAYTRHITYIFERVDPTPPPSVDDFFNAAVSVPSSSDIDMAKKLEKKIDKLIDKKKKAKGNKKRRLKQKIKKLTRKFFMLLGH